MKFSNFSVLILEQNVSTR